MTAAPDPVVRITGVREQPLSIDEMYLAVRDPRAGGVALFVGTVRAADHGHDVKGLSYSAHPTVDLRIAEIAAAVSGRHDLVALAVVHRVGELAVGDLAVVAATSAVHRGAALAACRDLIDEIKTGLPIWKHQMFGDGTDEWVGSP